MDPSKAVEELKAQFAQLERLGSVRSLIGILYPPCGLEMSYLSRVMHSSRPELITATRQLYTLVIPFQPNHQIMGRFIDEVKEPVARLWECVEQIAREIVLLQAVDAEVAVMGLVNTADKASELVQAAAELLPFCLENNDTNHATEYLPLAFRNGSSLHQWAARLQAAIKTRLLEVPQPWFVQALPPWPVVSPRIMAEPAPECPICAEIKNLHIEYCRGGCRRNRICYSCFRKRAWQTQHDQERVFTEPRDIQCPFCRQSIVLAECSTLLFTQPGIK